LLSVRDRREPSPLIDPFPGHGRPWLAAVLFFSVAIGSPLWETLSKGGEPVESRTPITTGAIEVVAPFLDRIPVLLAPFLDRIPVLLAPEDCERWLEPRIREPEALKPPSCPYPAGAMRTLPGGLAGERRHAR
jgi:putative SOS response-associated peptidase YedK